MRVNGTLVEDKMRRFKGECEHFRFNKCPIYIHNGASAKFSTNSQEMDNSVVRIYGDNMPADSKQNFNFKTGLFLNTNLSTLVDFEKKNERRCISVACPFNPLLQKLVLMNVTDSDSRMKCVPLKNIFISSCFLLI